MGVQKAGSGSASGFLRFLPVIRAIFVMGCDMTILMRERLKRDFRYRQDAAAFNYSF